MSNEHHNLVTEFPEFQNEIAHLKANDQHFKNLLEKHHEIDKKVRRSHDEVAPLCDENLEDLKKTRLKLQDELYGMLVKYKGVGV